MAKFKPVYRRALLKLSGDVLRGGHESGIDGDRVRGLAAEVAEVASAGVSLGVVIGGGNFIRGTQCSKWGIDRSTADYMGMLSTIMNALALQDAIERLGTATRVLSALECRAVCEPYIRRRALRHLEKGRVVILAGGTGNPYFSTDTTAALRACELCAEVLLKATKVSGVYSADPEKDPKAIRYSRLSYMEVLQRDLRVMDLTAISLCKDNQMPVVVFSLKEPGNIRRAVCGQDIGTLVSSEAAPAAAKAGRARKQ